MENLIPLVNGLYTNDLELNTTVMGMLNNLVDSSYDVFIRTISSSKQDVVIG